MEVVSLFVLSCRYSSYVKLEKAVSKCPAEGEFARGILLHRDVTARLISAKAVPAVQDGASVVPSAVSTPEDPRSNM